MKINDPVYGPIEITEPLALELINSYSLQRLKGIDQGGYSKPFHAADRIFYRFDHSIGVYWLLKKYQAPLAEQAAGLIHDVSHSAFSHCIDYVFKDGNGREQNHQDNLFENFVRQSDIPKIIKKYGLDINYILDDRNFPLKESLLPDLCADRIDYSLRTAVAYGQLTEGGAQDILASLSTQGGRWIFKDLVSAEKYARLFWQLNEEYYASLAGAIMHLTVGDYLRYALEHNYISETDLYTTDVQVLEKIAKFQETDAELAYLFKKMNTPAGFKNDSTDYEKIIHLKSRVVDPLFFSGEEIKKLSDAKPEWQKIITEELKPKSYWLKFKN